MHTHIHTQSTTNPEKMQVRRKHGIHTNKHTYIHTQATTNLEKRQKTSMVQAWRTYIHAYIHTYTHTYASTTNPEKIQVRRKHGIHTNIHTYTHTQATTNLEKRKKEKYGTSMAYIHTYIHRLPQTSKRGKKRNTAQAWHTESGSRPHFRASHFPRKRSNPAEFGVFRA